AGAKRPLWIIRNGELLQFPGDKFSIGSQFWENESFTNLTISISANDSIYLFSDGFADQFGGEHGKKLMTSNFKEELISIQNRNMNEQGKLLSEYFEKWKGANEQVDDVMVIGIKI
ncbi:MAG: serine/threonine protein kinase, partial [Bacteroidota bacterium]